MKFVSSYGILGAVLHFLQATYSPKSQTLQTMPSYGSLTLNDLRNDGARASVFPDSLVIIGCV